jgi:hypothetical protein
MPLTFTATGTIAPPIPYPANEGDGSIVTQNTTTQPDVLTALQRGTDLTQEVNSILGVLSVAAGKTPRVMLYALERTINRMIARCDDVTDTRNFTP